MTVPSVPVKAINHVFDTSKYFMSECVSLGIEHYNFFQKQECYFFSNNITTYKSFDERNLFSCKYLNLRCSHFKTICVKNLFQLTQIDISFSKVNNVNLRNCFLLNKVIID